MAAILRRPAALTYRCGAFRPELAPIQWLIGTIPGRAQGLELKIQPKDTPQLPDDAARLCSDHSKLLFRRFDNPTSRIVIAGRSCGPPAMATSNDNLARVQGLSAAGCVALEECEGSSYHSPRPSATRRPVRSDPGIPRFVSANDRSGKTPVPGAARSVWLSPLPAGKDPASTFPKSAAATWPSACSTTLGHWVTLDDDALAAGSARPARETDPAPRKVGARTLAWRGNTGRLKSRPSTRCVPQPAAAIPLLSQRPARFTVLRLSTTRPEMRELRQPSAVNARASRAPDKARSGARCCRRHA